MKHLIRRGLLACLFVSQLSISLIANSQTDSLDLASLRESPNNPLVEIQTSMGSMILELFPDEAPETVANFLDLAEGRKPFRDPESG